MDIKNEVARRVSWLKSILKETGAKGFVLGTSGGKDSVLVSILARMATPNVLGVIMPCDSKRNKTIDRDDAIMIAKHFDIKTIEVDLTPIKIAFRDLLMPLSSKQNDMAYNNMNPRLRMITVYNLAQRENYLVLGTGNRSEGTMGYFTKWGDGAHDVNPIGDLTVREIYKILFYLDCPEQIITKKPSAGLYEGQTDEGEMGMTYEQIDDYLLNGEAEPDIKKKIEDRMKMSEHKRQMPRVFPN